MTAETKHAFLTALEKTHGRQLRRYVAFRMRDAVADVPDLVQEIFLRMLRVEDYEAIRNSQAYLYTIASHVLYQHALRLKSTGESIDVSDVMPELHGLPADDPVAQLEMDQRAERIVRGLQEAAPRAYATLIMHRCDGLPLSEVSARLGCSYSMTKRYLAQALKYCHKLMAETE